MLLFGAGNCHACSLRPNSQVDLRCRRHGFLETLYLTYLKLTGADAFCPVGGGSCSKILDSDYAVVFGIPLALFGMAAYGLVAALGVQLASKNLRFGIEKSTAQVVLLGATTSMAAASAYFLYILTTRFSDSSCSYCLISAFLSFTLFYVTVKDIGLQEVSKQLGMQLLVASLVILSLNTSYSNSKSASSSLAENDLPYFATEITTPLSPFALSLAWHLHSIGAKMYGAFWCLHCQEQKEVCGHL
ncbi:Thiol-disulfide oxidoreductase LTO1 isoform A [Glycine soja]|uniref:Thiol-disulfide oxidoreductase LTO1 isoform A n=1 Tax=Glycine soja TaxID=3848 RepID=A0A445M436_GLYSO|nr:Thiol-disulfide oxidoreductase LTO1 isoform A [Glycine soja]